MEYLENAVEALGKALSLKDKDILYLRHEVESLKKENENLKQENKKLKSSGEAGNINIFVKEALKG